MEWRDQGAVLALRRHGETSAVLEVFTEAHGRHAGIVRGASSRRLAAALQPGSQVALTWRARLEEHLGSFAVEPTRSRTAAVIGDRLALSGLNAATSLLAFALPEREAHPRLYRRTVALLDMLGENPLWPLAYLKWEVALLDELGFGLDLSACAATGAKDVPLEHVSPRTGRAVSARGAGEWADRLLPLPSCLVDGGTGSREQLLDGFRLTGHFLERSVAAPISGRSLPEARRRFVDLYARIG